MVFSIVAHDRRTRARVGLLYTKSGEIETPFFMPVGTKTAVKHISSEDLESMGARAIISNAFILSLRPGIGVIKNIGGIGKFMSFPGIVFTDSGGFQMYTPNLYAGANEEGVIFKNPYSGEKKLITPEQNMEIQIALGSDVALCLDSMPLIEESKESITEAVRKTTLWAERCKKHHDRLEKDTEKIRKQLLFGIIQGGVHTDLREKSAEDISKIDFDGYAIGGLALGEPKEEEYKMIEIVKSITLESKPVYLMGAGEPLELIEAIARGCDMFDSRFPTQNARRGTLFTWQGRLNIKGASYKEDNGSIDSLCDCFVCKSYSRAYLHHVLAEEEGVGLRLASYHNLYFLQRLMEKARMAIRAGKFLEFKEDFEKDYNLQK